MSDRPRLGISTCLLGELVRYDGAHKRDAWLVEVLGPQVEWVPVCPEVEAGFGTPREPMQIERSPAGDVAMIGLQSGRDMAPAMLTFAAGRVAELADAELDGYVFKADSPSCDTNDGLFARSLIQRLPALPVIDERRLANPHERETFVERVFAHYRNGNAARRPVTVTHVGRGGRGSQPDHVATEEPLEIRLHGRPFAVIMRTPGADRELAAGFLLSERVIRSADDLGTIQHCTSAERQSADSNVVNVTLVGDASNALDRVLAERRNVTTNSSCGLCGRQTLESLDVDGPAVSSSLTMSSSLILELPNKLRAAQTVFDQTGGLHAAGLFARDATLVDVAEDVGRHNAVDKVVGRALMSERLPLSDHVLCVSGRTSFEILQKALFAGVPIVAAVSAPSSLAIDLADSFGITLIGFVRGDTFNIYAHAERIM